MDQPPEFWPATHQLRFAFRLREPAPDAPFLMAQCGHRQYQCDQVLLNYRVTDVQRQNFSDQYYRWLRRAPDWVVARLGPARCAECDLLPRLRQYAVICAHCLGVIQPGERVKLCSPERYPPGDFDRQTVVAGYHLCCWRPSCISPFAPFYGTWTGTGVANPVRHQDLAKGSLQPASK